MSLDICINRETLIKLDIDPNDAIEYIENKKAIDIHPCHVNALQILKRRPVASS